MKIYDFYKDGECSIIFYEPRWFWERDYVVKIFPVDRGQKVLMRESFTTDSFGKAIGFFEDRKQKAILFYTKYVEKRIKNKREKKIKYVDF